MHHSRSSARRKQLGITLLEMLVVVALIALIAGLSYSPVSAGLETLRLRAASDEVVSFLSTAHDRADRRQSVMEIQILPQANTMLARSSDQSFVKRLELPDSARIVNVEPAMLNADPRAVHRFLIYPGGSVPRIVVVLENQRGRRRAVSLDPFTGSARAVEVVKQ